MCKLTPQEATTSPRVTPTTASPVRAACTEAMAATVVMVAMEVLVVLEEPPREK